MKKLLSLCVLLCILLPAALMPVYAADPTVLVEFGSEWEYFVTDPDGYHDMDPAWKTKDFKENWDIGTAPFGDRIQNSNAADYGWVGDQHAIFVRQSFSVKSVNDLKGMHFYLHIFYDNTIHVYLNGTEIFVHDNSGANDWVDNYVLIELEDLSKLLVNGKNLLAVSVLDNTGGRELELELVASEEELEGTPPPPDAGSNDDDNTSSDTNENEEQPTVTEPIDGGSKHPFVDGITKPEDSIVTVYVTAEPVKTPSAPSVSYAIPYSIVGGAFGVSMLMVVIALLVSRKRRGGQS